MVGRKPIRIEFDADALPLAAVLLDDRPEIFRRICPSPVGPDANVLDVGRVPGLSQVWCTRQQRRFTVGAEVDLLVGDSGKARRNLGWEPTVSFAELVHLMVDSDLRLLAEGTVAI